MTFPNEYTVTVGKLKEMLKDFPDDLPIVMSSDSEGNSYGPLSDTGDGTDFYSPESSWSGELYADEEAGEWGIPDDAVKVLVLWPVN